MDWSKLNWANGAEWWWLVVAGVAVMVLGNLALFAWRRRVRERLGSPALVERLLASLSVPRQILRAVLATLGVGLVLLALLRPQYGLKDVQVTNTGVDIAVLLDVSQSMLVRDVAPNRFAASKREISKILEGLDGGRVSLIPFYLIPFVQSPLTSDFEALETYLRDLRLQDLSDPEMRGTNIGRALSRAVSVLSREELELARAEEDAAAAEEGTMAAGAPPHEGPAADDPDVAGFAGSKYKAIILFTDGEENEAIPEDLIQAARDAGIRIFAVGVGTKTGNAVPRVQDDGEVTGVLKDDSDQPVFSSVNEELLVELTNATGGAYFQFANRSVAPDIVEALRALEKKQFEADLEEMGEDRFQFVLIPAILLLGLELGLSERRRRRREGSDDEEGEA